MDNRDDAPGLAEAIAELVGSSGATTDLSALTGDQSGPDPCWQAVLDDLVDAYECVVESHQLKATGDCTTREAKHQQDAGRRRAVAARQALAALDRRCRWAKPLHETELPAALDPVARLLGDLEAARADYHNAAALAADVMLPDGALRLFPPGRLADMRLRLARRGALDRLYAAVRELEQYVPG